MSCQRPLSALIFNKMGIWEERRLIPRKRAFQPKYTEQVTAEEKKNTNQGEYLANEERTVCGP